MEAAKDTPAFTNVYDFWAEFGNLVYVSTARPMKRSAFEQIEPPLEQLGLSTKPKITPGHVATPKAAYALAFSLFHRALKIDKTWE